MPVLRETLIIQRFRAAQGGFVLLQNPHDRQQAAKCFCHGSVTAVPGGPTRLALRTPEPAPDSDPGKTRPGFVHCTDTHSPGVAPSVSRAENIHYTNYGEAVPQQLPSPRQPHHAGRAMKGRILGILLLTGLPGFAGADVSGL